jgi:hypothetical protein
LPDFAALDPCGKMPTMDKNAEQNISRPGHEPPQETGRGSLWLGFGLFWGFALVWFAVGFWFDAPGFTAWISVLTLAPIVPGVGLMMRGQPRTGWGILAGLVSALATDAVRWMGLLIVLAGLNSPPMTPEVNTRRASGRR